MAWGPNRLRRLVAGAAWLLAFGLALRSARADTRPFFLYMATDPPGGANSVAAWRVDTSGNLSTIAGSPFSTGGSGLANPAGAELAHRIAVSWSKNRLFAANEKEGSIAVFDVDPLTGVLRPVAGSPFSVQGWQNGSGGTSLAVSNDGQFLYGSTAIGASAPVLSFRVETTGSLTEIGAVWSFPFRINGTAVSSANDRLYLVESSANQLSVLKTGAGGLTPQPPVTLSIGSTPTDVAVNQAGNVLYVGTKNGGISAFRMEGDSITPLVGSPYFSGAANLNGLAPDFYERALVAFGATVPRAAGALIAGDGSLLSAPGSPVTPLIASTGGTLSPDGRLLFLSSAAAQLDAWQVDDAGALIHLPAYPTSVGVSSGFSKIVAFPNKAGSAAPALPTRALLWLFAVLVVLSVWRLAKPTATRHSMVWPRLGR